MNKRTADSDETTIFLSKVGQTISLILKRVYPNASTNCIHFLHALSETRNHPELRTSFSFSCWISFRAAMQFRVSTNVFRCALCVTLFINIPATLTDMKSIILASNYNIKQCLYQLKMFSVRFIFISKCLLVYMCVYIQLNWHVLLCVCVFIAIRILYVARFYFLKSVIIIAV